MIALSCTQLIEAVEGELLWGDVNKRFCEVTTDSRKVGLDNLFIPLVGEKFDGHDYIEQCFQKGAAICLTSKRISQIDNCTAVLVKDTSKALRDLASWHNKKMNIPVIGITGSVGKTSTKDMIACVLAKQYNVLKTQGNFNNEIGLPLTVFNIEASHEVAVLEMGMSGFGEISRLTAIARPRIAVITNIGVSHIEKLGSQQGILKAKLEILEGLQAGGLVVLNGDDQLLKGLDLLNHRVVYYGMGAGLQYSAKDYRSLGEAGSCFNIDYMGKAYEINIPVPGVHNVYNALAAVAVGIEMNIPLEIIIEGIAEYSPGNMRQNIVAHNGIKIINDAYNASPQSMQAAISVLEEISASKGKSIAVLGDMFEMGDMAKELHYSVGKFIADKNINYLITVGKDSQNIMQAVCDSENKSIVTKHFDNNKDALEYTLNLLNQGDYVLVKGSRGMKMEQIVEGLMGFSM